MTTENQDRVITEAYRGGQYKSQVLHPGAYNDNLEHSYNEMSVAGHNGSGRVEVILQRCKAGSCDVIRLPRIPCSTRQPRPQVRLEDAAAQAEFQGVRGSRERTRLAQVGPRASITWCTIRSACRRLKEVIQARLDGYIHECTNEREACKIV